MPLKTRGNHFGRECPDPIDPRFPDCPECSDGQTEFCCRMCWVDDCSCDWDLWMRDRNENLGNNWASYLNIGPVGETNMELNEDIEKPSNSDFCINPPPVLPAIGPEGYAGEMACACMDSDMSYPKIFDIITNLFGTDACTNPLKSLCLQCFCDGDEILLSTIQNVSPSHALQKTGNYGLAQGPPGATGSFRHTAIKFDRPCCTCWETYNMSICWSLSAIRVDGSVHTVRGPGKAPTKFVISDDIDANSTMLYQDGTLMPRRSYEVLHESVAKQTKTVTGQVGIKGEPCCGGKKKRRKKKSLF